MSRISSIEVLYFIFIAALSVFAFGPIVLGLIDIAGLFLVDHTITFVVWSPVKVFAGIVVFFLAGAIMSGGSL